MTTSGGALADMEPKGGEDEMDDGATVDTKLEESGEDETDGEATGGIEPEDETDGGALADINRVRSPYYSHLSRKIL
jgi:hypothetical protein